MSKRDLFDIYKQLDQNVEKEEISGLELHNYLIFRIMKEKYFTKKKGDKIVFDIQAGLKNETLISHHYKDRPQALSDMLYKMSKFLEEEYIKKGIKIDEPKKHFIGYVRKQEIFGKDTNKRSFSALCNEIETLILKGEILKDHSRRLQLAFHLKNVNIEGLWELILGDPNISLSEQFHS